ncbi:MAG TPA: ThiF family adenylyltransferase [Thermoanaerobaculia bacterium]|nr:ThiF family adenylyltransferase [Thermoanaerobaculia bacterium]
MTREETPSSPPLSREETEGERHSRSILFPGIAEAGQQRIARFSMAIVGVGAVGAAAAELAARAGVGRLSVIDRDVVEESNLSRQLLFDADDAARVAPKATAAQERLSKVAPGVSVRGVVADLTPENARELLEGHDLVLDASDNFETRLLVSDASRSLGLSSIYAACVGEEGLLAVSVPGKTPCLRCYLEALPPAGSSPTCDTVGIVPTLPPLVASLAVTEALRIATGREPSRGVLAVRVWQEGFRSIRSFEDAGPRRDCPVCSRGSFPALQSRAAEVVKLCGRRSVQVAPPARERPDFDALEERLARVGRVRRSPQLLNADVDGVSLTIFSDGRCVVRGTEDPARARRLYDRFVGR